MPLSTSLFIAAAASGGAGLVHAAAAGTHSGDADLAWMFALCAAAQIGWAALAIAWPRRGVLAAGILLNGGCVAVWALTRTVGLFGPLADVEAVATQDLAAAVLGAAAAVAAALALARSFRSSPDDATRPARRIDIAAVGVAAALVLVLAVPAMAASHSHSGTDHAHGTVAAAAHSHDDGDAEVAAHGHDGDPAAHDHPGADEGTGATTEVATGPIVSIDDPRLTDAQRARSQSLLDRTRVALLAFPDEASLVAAGYRSIGDGRRVGSFEHFVHPEYRADGRELDPAHIESIVTSLQVDGTKKIMSAMYIAEPSTTMETVPDVGGELTVWHDHQNLCWDANGRLAGVLVDGQCRPGGTFRGTAPMIHVWLDTPACGPFTGIEGHGGGNCEHSHVPA